MPEIIDRIALFSDRLTRGIYGVAATIIGGPADLYNSTRTFMGGAYNPNIPMGSHWLNDKLNKAYEYGYSLESKLRGVKIIQPQNKDRTDDLIEGAANLTVMAGIVLVPPAATRIYGSSVATTVLTQGKNSFKLAGAFVVPAGISAITDPSAAREEQLIQERKKILAAPEPQNNGSVLSPI